MRKKIFSALAALSLVLALGLSAYAEEIPASTHTIPDERLIDRVTDTASVLTAEELSSLNARADEVSEAYLCDVAVAFVSGTDGMGVQSYADDYYDYNGFGGDDSGILLLVDVTGRQYAVSTYGCGAYAFTDAGQSYMDEKYLPYLSAGDWAGAADAFISASAELLAAAQNGSPYDTGSMPRGSFPVMWIAIDLIAGLVLAFIPVGIMKKKLKTVEAQSGAESYVAEYDIPAPRCSDRFLYKTVNRTPRPRDNNNGPGPGGGHGGGSRMHTSSSGRSHGGHSGRF